jgi:hypothetical protein
MMKICTTAILLLFFAYNSIAELITITASADANNNNIGRFIEYIFTFDTERDGYYTLDGSPPIIYTTIDGVEPFYARYDGLFNLPISDFDLRGTVYCGLNDINSSAAFLLMCVNGNSICVSGNSIADWQVGDFLEGIERGFYADGTEREIGSNLTITDIRYAGMSVPEPSTYNLFFTGSGLLCFCWFFVRKKRVTKKV